MTLDEAWLCAEIDRMLDLLVDIESDNDVHSSVDGSEGARLAFSCALGGLGEALGRRALGSPPNIELAHRLAQQTVGDEHFDVPAWQIETLLRHFAGDMAVVAGLTDTQKFGAAVEAVDVLVEYLALPHAEAASLRSEVLGTLLPRLPHLQALFAERPSGAVDG